MQAYRSKVKTHLNNGKLTDFHFLSSDVVMVMPK